MKLTAPAVLRRIVLALLFGALTWLFLDSAPMAIRLNQWPALVVVVSGVVAMAVYVFSRNWRD